MKSRNDHAWIKEGYPIWLGYIFGLSEVYVLFSLKYPRIKQLYAWIKKGYPICLGYTFGLSEVYVMFFLEYPRIKQ